LTQFILQSRQARRSTEAEILG